MTSTQSTKTKGATSISETGSNNQSAGMGEFSTYLSQRHSSSKVTLKKLLPRGKKMIYYIKINIANNSSKYDKKNYTGELDGTR